MHQSVENLLAERPKAQVASMQRAGMKEEAPMSRDELQKMMSAQRNMFQVPVDNDCKDEQSPEDVEALAEKARTLYQQKKLDTEPELTVFIKREDDVSEYVQKYVRSHGADYRVEFVELESMSEEERPSWLSVDDITVVQADGKIFTKDSAFMRLRILAQGTKVRASRLRKKKKKAEAAHSQEDMIFPESMTLEQILPLPFVSTLSRENGPIVEGSFSPFPDQIRQNFT